MGQTSLSCTIHKQLLRGSVCSRVQEQPPKLPGDRGATGHTTSPGAVPAQRLRRQLCSREQGRRVFASGELVASEEPPAAGTQSPGPCEMPQVLDKNPPIFNAHQNKPNISL